MKYFIILLIASFVFFGCDANDAGSGDGSPQVADLCLGVESENTTHTLDDGKDYTIIRNQDGLQAIRDDLAVNYLLCADIDIDPTSTFAQLNPNTDIDNDSSTFDGTEFTGTFNGNNKTISNLRIQASQDDYVGLFGKIGADGEVRNLTLSLAEDANDPGISGNIYVGALAGRNEGTITNVGVTGGTVEGTDYRIGGLVGDNAGTITASYATGSVTGNSNVGGLVGFNSGEITQSYATGAVTSSDRYSQIIGGLVGYNAGTITASYATGTVTTQDYSYSIGGLVGYNDGTITASYATGDVTGLGSDISQIGGLIGYNSDTITASYATGSVTGNDHVGGLVGYNEGGTITASYATGSVTGNSNVGGLVGYNEGYNEGGTITTSYFDAETTEQSLFIGNESVADRAYYTDTTSADREVYTQANGTGDKIDQSNFPNWNFDTVWTWQEGQWPTFQFQ